MVNTAPRTKLSDAKIKQISALHNEGKTYKEIAAITGVSYVSVKRYVTGQRKTPVESQRKTSETINIVRINDLRSQGYTFQQIAELEHISASTAYRVCRKPKPVDDNADNKELDAIKANNSNLYAENVALRNENESLKADITALTRRVNILTSMVQNTYDSLGTAIDVFNNK